MKALFVSVALRFKFPLKAEEIPDMPPGLTLAGKLYVIHMRSFHGSMLAISSARWIAKITATSRCLHFSMNKCGRRGSAPVTGSQQSGRRSSPSAQTTGRGLLCTTS